MTSPKGELILSAGGAKYRLHFGWSGIADMQAKYGQDFMTRLQPPEDAPEDWLPDFSVIVDLIAIGLERYHKDAVNKWLVDDIVKENPGAFDLLMKDTFPDQSDAGNGKGPKVTPQAD